MNDTTLSLEPTPALGWSQKWARFRHFVGQAWALSHPYFSSEDRVKAWALLVSIVALNLGAVYMLVLLNEWNRLFYDALQNKDHVVFWRELWHFVWLAAIFIVIAVYRFYLTELLQLRWRVWMTAQYTQRWLSQQAFYRLELGRYANDGKTPQADNPDQRIHEDIDHFTGMTVGLTMGLLNSVVTLVSFVGILWTLSADFGLPWFNGETLAIPGFMVWAAVVYALVGSVLAHYIGRRQIPLNYEQQRREADYRHMLVRTREYSDAIALDGGEPWQTQGLGARFTAAITNYLRLLRARKQLIWFTVGFGQAATVFPFIIAAPYYFTGLIQLGQLMQVSSAFGRVQDALSWFVDNYPSLAVWRATTDRLTRFDHAVQQVLAQAEAPSSDGPQDTTPSPSSAPESAADATAPHTHWHAQRLQLELPNGQALGQALDFDIQPGERVWIQGPSGCGKSTLLRTLAGIWPWHSGELTRPEMTAVLFLPQRPYFPNGALREALAYPDGDARFSDAQLSAALNHALLPELVTRLDEQAAWSQVLSGGEQQRLALARVFLRQPRWLFLDEATSALDEAAEETLYQRLVDWAEQHQAALVSIAHRPQLARFHQRSLRLSAAKSGD